MGQPKKISSANNILDLSAQSIWERSNKYVDIIPWPPVNVAQ